MSVGPSVNLNFTPPAQQVQPTNSRTNNANNANPGPRASALARANTPNAAAAPPPAIFVPATAPAAPGGTTAPAAGRGAPAAPAAPAAQAVAANVSPANNPAAFPAALAAMGAVGAASIGEKQRTGDIRRDRGQAGRSDRGADNTQTVDQPTALAEAGSEAARDATSGDSAAGQTSGPAT